MLLPLLPSNPPSQAGCFAHFLHLWGKYLLLGGRRNFSRCRGSEGGPECGEGESWHHGGFPTFLRGWLSLVLSLGATKDMGKMLGGDEEKDPDAAKKEEERQEALRQEEEERKAKYAKMEAEREVMRQGIRDKVGIWLSSHTGHLNAQWSIVFRWFVTSSLSTWIEPGNYFATLNFLILWTVPRALSLFKHTSRTEKPCKIEIWMSIFLIICYMLTLFLMLEVSLPVCECFPSSHLCFVKRVIIQCVSERDIPSMLYIATKAFFLLTGEMWKIYSAFHI